MLLQIPPLILPEETFTEYAYFSSFSDSWVKHAKDYVDSTVKRLELGPESFVIEVASNDGYLLQHVMAAGVPCLGIEPAANVSEAARRRNVPTLNEFLSEAVAAEVVAQYGQASLVVANNVYAHIPDPVDFTRALRALVTNDGHISIEVHYALNLIAEAQFDTIYHEHFQYYTVLSAQRALSTAGLDLIDVEHLTTHGGSIRLWARPREAAAQVSPSVAAAIAKEREANLDTFDGYRGLTERVAVIRRELVSLLIDCARKGLSVGGYGAPGKGNTLLNYCGIRADLLPYTVDRNPYKHGRFTPGTRIPVLAPEKIEQDRPQMIVVLPWNLRREIGEQLAWTSDWGAKLVFPLPTLRVIDAGTEVAAA